MSAARKKLPIGIQTFADIREGGYWFESTTPTLLVEILKQRGVFTPRLDKLQAKAQLLGRFDVDDMTTEGLLFQTGYLTVKQIEEPLVGYQRYTLGLPQSGGGEQPQRASASDARHRRYPTAGASAGSTGRTQQP